MKLSLVTLIDTKHMLEINLKTYLKRPEELSLLIENTKRDIETIQTLIDATYTTI